MIRRRYAFIMLKDCPWNQFLCVLARVSAVVELLNHVWSDARHVVARLALVNVNRRSKLSSKKANEGRSRDRSIVRQVGPKKENFMHISSAKARANKSCIKTLKFNLPEASKLLLHRPN